MILSHRRAGPGPRPGFTLLEVLAVVAILVILVGVGGVVYLRYIDESRESTAKLGTRTLEDVVMAYRTTTGEFPADLTVLTVPIDGKPAVLEERHLLDPWGRPYVYEPTNIHPSTGKPRIYSQGSQPGASVPIANW
jgi:prepilin-type N-terminal cleavage/methylation domain-containing protein